MLLKELGGVGGRLLAADIGELAKRMCRCWQDALHLSGVL